MNDQRLATLYESHFDGVVLERSLAARSSAPLLLSIPKSWAADTRRVLIVGQETLGWEFKPGEYYQWPYVPIGTFADFVAAPNRVQALMYGYRQFEFACHQPDNFHSPFWRTFRDVGSRLSATLLWTNLFRWSLDRGSVIANGSAADVFTLRVAQRSLLKREIEILSPTAILFLTGPRYDSALQDELADAIFVLCLAT